MFPRPSVKRASLEGHLKTCNCCEWSFGLLHTNSTKFWCVPRSPLELHARYQTTAHSCEWISAYFFYFSISIFLLPVFTHYSPLLVAVIQFLQPASMASANSSSATSRVPWLHRDRFPQLLTSKGVSGYLTLTESSSRLFCHLIS